MSSVASRQRFFLSEHIFICPANHHWIVLDVKGDRYISIARRHLTLLGPWLHGWQEQHDRSDRESLDPHSEVAQLVDELVSQGILCAGGDGAKEVRPLDFSKPNADLPTRTARVNVVMRFARARAVIWACRTADHNLQNFSFESVVRCVMARRQAALAARRAFDVKKAASLVATFNSLQLFYPRRQLCLPSSLALIEYLARYQLFPAWRFGVKPDPMQAHCWIQEEGLVINDTVEHVSEFIPIMQI